MLEVMMKVIIEIEIMMSTEMIVVESMGITDR